MEVRPGYKQTEVGVIPEEWGVRPLGELATTIASGRSKAQAGGGIHPVHGSTGVIGYSRGADYEGDAILVARVGANAGKLDMVSGQYGVTDNTIILRLRVDSCLPFFWRQLEGKRLNSLVFGSGQPLITGTQLKNLPVSIPPLPEQRAIAGALSDVDVLIGALDRLIAKKRDLKQAAMQQLLTGQTRLPGFSGEWEVKRLGDVAALNRMNVIPASSPDQLFVHFSLPAFDAGKVPIVELGSAIGSNKFRVPQEAILVSKLNPRIPRVWAPTEIPAEAIASSEFLVLTPKEGVSRSFLYVICSSASFCEQMELSATGTTGSHQRISPAGALGLTVSVPVDVGEQAGIAAVLSDMDAELAALEQRLAKTRALKQGMMQELLTGRIRLV